MSLESALLARAGPHVFAQRMRASIGLEVLKGCQTEIRPFPVPLEPVFVPIGDLQGSRNGEFILPMEREAPVAPGEVLGLRTWIPPDQELDWLRSERFLKQLKSVTNRLGLDVAGNCEDIAIHILCDAADLPVVLAAFQGEFPRCELVADTWRPVKGVSLSQWRDAVLFDWVPSPPYSRLLTCPNELHFSPYEPLIAALASIPPDMMGVYQALFQPVAPTHDWHRNVEALQDIEYLVKLIDGAPAVQRYPQQAPSFDLRQMAGEVERKAHNDKPFFAMVLRATVIGAGSDGPALLRSIASFASLFQFGGSSMRELTECDYRDVVSTEQIAAMFTRGLSHRPGFLVNTWELTGAVHVPSPAAFKERCLPVRTLQTLPVKSDLLSVGTPIGTCEYAGREQTVHIPPSFRLGHTHAIGKPAMGKSTLLERMILSDILAGHGVAVLDPHGDLVERLLGLISESDFARVIYFDPGDSQWIPIWNPLKLIAGQNISRTADDMVGSLQSVVTGWGDRLEHLLRFAFLGALHLPGGTLLDVSNLLRKDSDKSQRLRAEILQAVENEAARGFWNEFEKYGKDDVRAPQHKLSKLLAYDSVALMLSQPDSSFNLREVMDQGMIFLANLSTIGSEVRQDLGSLLFSQFHLAALTRSDTPSDQRRSSHLYCDEAHRFMTSAMEDTIAETRKFGLSLTLAHQYRSQFEVRKADALSNVRATIVFNVGVKDARHLVSDFRGRVKIEDLIAMEVGDAIARIGSEVVRIRTLDRTPGFQEERRDRLIADSRRRHCKPAHEVREALRHKGQSRPRKAVFCPPASSGGSIEEFTYDEF